MAKIAQKPAEPKLKYKYACPACTGTAIETSNIMLGVEIDCKNCGTRIKLDSKEAYQKI